MSMGKTAIALVILVFMGLFCGGGLVSAYDSEDDVELYERSRGPIPIRNQTPLYLFYLQMTPDRSSVTERGKFSVNADYMVSNITISAFTPTGSILITPEYEIDIDLEVSRMTLDFRYGVYDNLEIDLEVPYISLSSGYLDNFIEGFEDAIGARTPRSRERQGSYKFDYSVKRNSKYLIQEKDHQEGLGDVVLSAKYQLLKDTGWYWFMPNFSLRSAVKFPTGKKDDLLGSGELDYGIGALLDKAFFEKLFVYLGGNVVFIETPSFFSELAMEKEIYSGLVAIEYFFTDRFSVVTQVTANSTPYPSTGTNPMDNEGYDFALGFNYRCKEKGNILWDFAIVENISAASTPDVSFHTGLNWKF